MIDALARARFERFTLSEDLLASILETLHALWRTTLLVHSRKGAKLPPPLVIERPGTSPRKPLLPTMSVRDFARALPRGKVTGPRYEHPRASQGRERASQGPSRADRGGSA